MVSKDSSKDDSIDWNWWSDPWWFDPKYADHVEYTKEEIHNSFELLRKHFTPSWMESMHSQRVDNIVFRNLWGIKGTGPLSLLCNLGSALHAMQDCPGINKKIRALKNKESRSSYFELMVAALFHKEGFDIQFPKEGQSKIHDISASIGNECIAIECKRLERERWEKWADNLTFQLISSDAWRHKHEGLKLEIFLDPRLSEIRFDDDNEPEINESIMESLVKEITADIEKIKKPVVGAEFRISAFGKGRFVQAKENETVEMSSIEISMVSQLRRVINNGFLRACSQLPSDLPGIVFVNTPYSPNFEQTSLVFNAIINSNQNRFRNVAALFISSSGVNASQNNMLLLNKQSKFEPMKLSSIQAIIKAMEPRI